MRKITLLILLLLSKTLYAFDTSAKYAVLIDADTKEILFAKNADEKMAPSSMSKIITAYVIFDYLKSNNLRLNDTFINSENAWKKQGSRMFISLHAKVTIDELLKGLIVQSGNDAAITLAEGVAGTEQEFAELANKYIHNLGLKNTNINNATGWPDKEHYSTAYDLSLVAAYTIKTYPEYYYYYAIKEFEYNNIKQSNRNGLLYSYKGTDGLKTGHTESAGYGLVASAKKDNRRLIAVVNGLNSEKQRNVECEKIFNYGFMNYKNVTIAKKDETIDKAAVIFGKNNKIELTTKEDIIVTVPNFNKEVKQVIKYTKKLKAPIFKGEEIATMILSYNNKEISYPLVAKYDIHKSNLLYRMIQSVKYLLISS